MRERLDIVLVERGLCPTRARARDAVRRGHVRINGMIAAKPAQSILATDAITVDDPAGGYVSRGALKLAAALDAFGFDPSGLTCLDLGASTGGFSQVLMERGAKHVVAVDVGHGQLHETLRGDTRLTSIEGRNVRDLTASDVPAKPQALVADLSFISLRTALPSALDLMAPGSWLAVLVKPQFEVGRPHVGKGGIVRDASLAHASVDDVATWLDARGWRSLAPITSPIAGGDGNTEYLLGARHDG